MSEISDILDNALQQILSNLADKGINASGRTARGFKVIETPTSVRLIYDIGEGGAPLGTLERGRVAGKVPEGFTAIIEQWAKDKGINFGSEQELRSFAGAVAYGKIKQRGFGRPSPSDHGSEDNTVYSDVVYNTAVELYNKVPAIIVSYITKQIK